MSSSQTLFAVTLDSAPFALVMAFDEVDAADLAFGIYAFQWFGLSAANDHETSVPHLAAAKHRRQFAARQPTESERHRFAVQAQQLVGGTSSLTACIVTEEYGAFEYERLQD